MKNISFTAAALCLSAGSAFAATVDTNNWTGTVAPALLRTATPFTSPTATSATMPSNDSGSLISDFTLAGNFTYSLSLRGNSSDDDVLGLLLGWTDPSNNIRMGVSYGGLGDSGNSFETNNFCTLDCLADGFWIIQEINDVSTVLVEQSGFVGAPNTTYDLSVARTGGTLSYSFGTGGTTTFSGTVTPTASMSGAVGIYAESQIGTFTNIAVSAAPIPLPASAVLLAAGLGGLGFVARRRKAKS